MSLRQGRRSILDYTIEFRTLAADSGWNNAALVDAFLSSRSLRIKDQLIKDDHDNVITIVNKIDHRLRDHDRE